MAISLTCDGVKRRDFLKVGAIGAGLSLSGYLRLAAAGEVTGAKAKSAIERLQARLELELLEAESEALEQLRLLMKSATKRVRTRGGVREPCHGARTECRRTTGGGDGKPTTSDGLPGHGGGSARGEGACARRSREGIHGKARRRDLSVYVRGKKHFENGPYNQSGPHFLRLHRGQLRQGWNARRVEGLGSQAPGSG